MSAKWNKISYFGVLLVYCFIGKEGSFAIQFFSQKNNLNYDSNDKKDCAEFYCFFGCPMAMVPANCEKKLATDLLGRLVLSLFENIIM